MDVINSTGVSIYLQLNPKAIFSRLVNAKQKRPLLKDKNEEQLLEYITTELSRREPFYLKSNHIVNGVSVDVDYIVSSIK
jgi:shikimate kinase